MVSDAQRAAVRRIAVALESAPNARAALAAAAELAIQLDAEIDALFVEDVTLMHVAELNLGREFVISSGQARPFDVAAIESWYRREAAETKRIAETLARERRVTCTFRVTRGRILEIVSAPLEAELLVIAIAGRHRVGAPPAKPRVAVVYDGSPGAQNALEAAAALGEVTVLLTDESLREQAAARLPTAAFRTLETATREAVFRVARELDADFLIMP